MPNEYVKKISDCEMSVFCDHLIVGDTLPGFKAFVVKFMLQMSKVKEHHYSVNEFFHIFLP